MNVLPWLLFLFQSLPLFFQNIFFNCLDKTVSSFIWAGKIPKVNKTILQCRKSDGGLALPIVLFYYWAANISKISVWYNVPEVNWCTLEAATCTFSCLSTLVFAPLSLRPSSYTRNPIVLTLKIWKQFWQHFHLKSLSVFSSICNNHVFLPSVIDHILLDGVIKALFVSQIFSLIILLLLSMTSYPNIIYILQVFSTS